MGELNKNIAKYEILLKELEQREVAIKLRHLDRKDICEKDNARIKIELIKKLEELNIVLSNRIKFKVINYPKESSKPIKPNKILIVSESAFVGLLVAVFMAFFAEFLEKIRGTK